MPSSVFLSVYVEDGAERKRPYLLLLATAAHTRRIAITARMVRMITSQSRGRKATTSITQIGQEHPGMIEFFVM